MVADVPGWAWDVKARAYQQFLSPFFDIELVYHTGLAGLDFDRFDLVHLFEVSQTGILPTTYKGRAVAGLTAHVWPTWGVEKMRLWASKVHALHGNSKLLVEDLRQFHSRVYYTPNGVDSKFWARSVPRPAGPVTVCHVGKPNPRKGAGLIVEAARRVGVKLFLVQRTQQIRLTPEQIKTLYELTWVQVTASDMDGTPNPMLEAAACSNALLSTPIGNMPEFLEPGLYAPAGRLIPWPSDKPRITSKDEWQSEGSASWRKTLIDSLAEELAWFVAHPQETADMGMRARELVKEKWTWDLQVGRVLQMWAEVLDL